MGKHRLPAGCISTLQLIERCGLTIQGYYRLRAIGVIPPPQTGSLIRKFYSPQEVRTIERALAKAGELRTTQHS